MSVVLIPKPNNKRNPSMNLKGSQTEKNLLTAFAGEPLAR